MNFLGHFYLSHHENGLLIGNFLADFVKGKRFEEYPVPIAEGILMHRQLDTFTDEHPAILNCTALLRPQFGKFSGILVDMYFDFYLASQWQRFNSEGLALFAQKVYIKLNAKQHLYPLAAQKSLWHMQHHDWLNAYAHAEGLGSAINGIAVRLSRRLQKPISFDKAVSFLQENQQLLFKNFDTFFSDVQKFAEKY